MTVPPIANPKEIPPVWRSNHTERTLDPQPRPQITIRFTALKIPTEQLAIDNSANPSEKVCSI